MSDIILHHYPKSPFAEKVRVALGVKGLSWHSVVIPTIMPKPELMPLTGCYRRTPVMQIGADIYCDTQLILREIERRFPQPSLYRGTDAGTSNAMAFWSDRSLFATVFGVALANRTEALPAGFIEDRTSFAGRELDITRFRKRLPLLLDRLRAQLGWYEQMLGEGRPFLMGQHSTLVDCAAYQLCWFLQQNSPANAAPLAESLTLQSWMTRVREIGHGRPQTMSAQQVLAVATAATPLVTAAMDAHDPAGRKPGDAVQIVPDDTGRDPVVGELLASSHSEIVIRRIDERVGEVAVHFPRAGFIVQPARA